MTTEYCGFVKFIREHRERLVCIYRRRDTITSAKQAFLEYVRQQEEKAMLLNHKCEISLVHIARSIGLSEAELRQQYKEEVGC